ncbi:MAG: hypothetical protein ACOC80_13085 [Petrotogales bacterium]
MDNKEVRADWEEMKVKNRKDFFKKLKLIGHAFDLYIEEHKNNMRDKDKRLLRTIEAYFVSLIDVGESIDHLIFRMVNYAKEE